MKARTNDRNFSATFTVERTPEEAFAAIKNPRKWWSENIDGNTDKVGDEFTYRYGDVHYCRLRVTKLLPGKKVTWLVLENRFSFTKDKTEWKGTEITFEIAPKGDRTEVRFAHVGLVPDYECYDVCSTAWGSYLSGSLPKLITTGVGRPNKKEKGVGKMSPPRVGDAP
jgi:hypothetical protein